MGEERWTIFCERGTTEDGHPSISYRVEGPNTGGDIEVVPAARLREIANLLSNGGYEHPENGRAAALIAIETVSPDSLQLR